MHTLGADKAVGGNVDEGFKGGRGCLILAVLFADRPTLFCQPRTWLFLWQDDDGATAHGTTARVLYDKKNRANNLDVNAINTA